MNQYRNAHHMTLNKAKAVFKEQMTPEILKLPDFEVVKLSYILHCRTKHLQDVSNPCSIVDKFFSDALVELGKLPDDNYNHLLGVEYLFGSVDPINPRVDVTIHKLD